MDMHGAWTIIILKIIMCVQNDCYWFFSFNHMHNSHQTQNPTKNPFSTTIRSKYCWMLNANSYHFLRFQYLIFLTSFLFLNSEIWMQKILSSSKHIITYEPIHWRWNHFINFNILIDLLKMVAQRFQIKFVCNKNQ